MNAAEFSAAVCTLIVMVIDDADPGRNILIFDKESQVE